MQQLDSATRPPAQAPPAGWMSRSRWTRRSAAILLTLAAPLVSISGALTTGLNGTSPAVRFPPGYGVTMAATVAATTLAALLAARRGRASHSSHGAAGLSPQRQPSTAVPAAPGPDAT